MKTSFTLLFSFCMSLMLAQTEQYITLLDSAKTLFNKEKGLNYEELEKFDYYEVVSLLEKVIELNPACSEAHYFLGYTYSRINSRDGRGMINMSLSLLNKSSAELEEVIRLTPKYLDEIIVLDPYSKLSAEWGSMAMSYWHNNKPDSAIWAFKEGKIRGGFGDFILDVNRRVLGACDKNAILISSGDNFSIPLWYLQITENYRTDVSVVDISLLNTKWYPAFLLKNEYVKFDLPKEEMDTLQYTTWTDSIITINDFSWTVKPSYYDEYLLRGDRLFLSLLKENKFERDLYFTIAFMESSRLSLKDYLSGKVVVDQLNTGKIQAIPFKKYKEQIKDMLNLSKKLNLNSIDELKLYDNFRYDIINKIRSYIESGKKKKAKELLALLDKYGNKSIVPYTNEKVEKYVEYLNTLF